MNSTPLCGLCNQPMPKGEEMFQYHGYSGSCPKTCSCDPSKKEGCTNCLPAEQAAPPRPKWVTEFYDALRHANGLTSEIEADLEDSESEKEVIAVLEKLRGLSGHLLGCTVDFSMRYELNPDGTPAAPAAIEQARPQTPTLAIFLERTAKELASRTNLLDHAFSEMREIAEKELHARSRTIDSLDSEEIPNQRPSPDSGTDRPGATLHSEPQPVTAAAEPAPERTPPLDEFIAERAERMANRMYSKETATYFLNRFLERARAVAVPEPAAQQECPNCGSTKRSDRSYVDLGIHCTNPWHDEGAK